MKRIVFFLLAIAVLLSITACSGYNGIIENILAMRTIAMLSTPLFVLIKKLMIVFHSLLRRMEQFPTV